MIHANAHAWLRALLCVIALGACKPEDEAATQIIVSVNSNLEIGDEIVRVRIELKEIGGNGSGTTRSFNLSSGSGGTRFPFSFGIQKGSANRVTVIATGFGPINGGEDGAVIERKENVRFKAGETQLLKLFLNDVCLGNLCEGSETCQSNAQCGAVRDANLDPIAPGDEDDAWDESASGAGGEGGAGEGGAGEGGAGEGGAGGEAGGPGGGGAGEGGAGGEAGGPGGGGAGGEAGGPGGCTPACGAFEECIDQTCECSVPMTTYYLDSDGDGYGDPTRALESCGVPDGYVEDSTDCCDDDEAVYPMSMEWSFVPSACGLGDDGPSDWDFDCDGVVEAIISIRSGECCDYANAWSDGWLGSTAPFCGEPGTISICNEETCIFEDTDVFQECW